MENYELYSMELKDYEKLKKFFALRPARTCESIVTNSFIWKDYYQAKYYINKYGIVFLYYLDNEVFTSSPLCKSQDLKACIEDMEKYFNQVLGKKLLLYVADEDTVNALKDMTDKYEIEEDRRYFDYVYDGEKLRTLSGKKYHKKKNHVNGFLKEYGDRYEARRLCCSDRELIFTFLDKWHKARDIQDEYNRDKYEIEGIKYLLQDCSKVDMEMYGVFIDGELQAFTLGTYLKDLKMVFVHVEKANPEIRGLYPFINQQFQRDCFPEAELVNREDDMGLDGLRQAKMSYNPLYMEKKYTIRQR